MRLRSGARVIWAVFALLTGIAVFSVLLPLARRPRADVQSELDRQFYHAQVAEIDGDAGRGLIAPGDAEATKAEAARRFMAAAQKAPASRPTSPWATRVAACMALIFVPAVALLLYSRVGNPELPDAPLEARLESAPAAMDIQVAIAKIEAHLAANPDDGRGYEVIAPTYLRLGRVDDAIRAYGEALRLLGETPARRAAYGEALVYAASGVVTADARRSFEQAQTEDPSLPKAGFYLGMAAEQDGDLDKARRIWGDLIARAPPDAPWLPTVQARLAGAVPASPKQEAARQIAALPAGAQQTAIRGMVDGLAARLATDGRDVEGWLRLMRAYTVLDEGDKARQALVDARRNLAQDSGAITRIGALARELGLES